MIQRLALSAFIGLVLFPFHGLETPAKPVLRVGHGTRENVENFYDTLLVREACARAGYDMVVVEAPFRRILEMAENGEVDAVCNALATEDRMAFLLYPQTPLVEYEQCLFAPKGVAHAYDGSLGSLTGGRIGTVRGFSYSPDFDRLAESGSIITVEAFATRPLALMLYHGRVPAIIENPITLAYEVRDLPDFWQRVAMLSPPVASQPAYVAFSRASPAARSAMQAFDRALASMKKDGTWDRIVEKAVALPPRP